VAEQRDVTLVLDFCLRVGEVLLASGAGAADVSATMQSLARTLGARQADVDITFTSLSMSYQERPEDWPLVANRQVRSRVIDYQDLTRVDHLVREVLRGDLALPDARAELLRIVSTGHDRPRWAVSLGWGVMVAGIGLQVGGDLTVCLLGLLASVIIDRLQLRMSRRRFPYFYQQVVGGAVATLVAVVAAVTPLEVDVSLVVTANIVMLLAGIGFMGALQDALTGFYITAGARLIEVLLATAGIIAGVTGGLGIAVAAGSDLPPLDPGPDTIPSLGLTALGAALAAAAFAFSSYSPKRVLVPVALVSAVAISISRVDVARGVGQTWAVAIAATFVGLVGYGVAARLRVPPLVVVVSAVVPMLPGLSIYRGLSLLAEAEPGYSSEGILALVTAAATALALAAGVLLGEYVVQPLAREARRLEDRLSGPRLVGPVRVRTDRVRRRRVRSRPRRETPGTPAPSEEPEIR